MKIRALVLSALLVLPAAASGLQAQFNPHYNPAVCADHVPGEALSNACRVMMEQFPVPPGEPVSRDGYTLGQYSFWRIGPAATPLYDVPNGGVVGEIPAGFNFVRAIDLSVDGWLQINGGQWIQRALGEYRAASEFTGVTLPDGIAHEWAYILDLSRIYVSEYPGGPPSEATGRYLNRYERVNIFARQFDDEGWEWYMIGPDQWVKQTFVAKVHGVERPEGVSGRWVAIDLYEQTLVAFEDDTPVFATLVATGIPPNDTNEGLFEVWATVDRDDMSGATGAPDSYALQSVPWVMYFDGQISLHGTYWHDLFGYRQSHGCVNLSISDARWLQAWMSETEPDEDGEIVNHVLVYSSGEYGGGVIRGQ